MASASPPSTSAGSRMLIPLASPSGATMDQDTVVSPTALQAPTTKEWIIPPRPKPGRKPATDTPPTKRKAQNRAAQRAFRERRAAKVDDLEGHMDEMARIHQAELDALNQRFEESLGVYQGKAHLLEARCKQLEDDLKTERKFRLDLETQLAVSRNEAVALPPRAQRANDHAVQERGGMMTAEQAYNTPDEMTLGCERCSLKRCQCYEDVVNGDFGVEIMQETTKRQPSPKRSHAHPNKRIRPEIKREDDSEDLFLEVPAPLVHSSSVHLDMPNKMDPVRPAESCGFCQDGSSCPCADMDADRERALNDHGSRLPSPPSEHTVDAMAIDHDYDATLNMESAACATEPGSCNQCQCDPESKRFCRTLAATRKTTAPPLSEKPSNPLPLPMNAIVPCEAGQACCRISSALSSLASASASSTQSTSTTADSLSMPNELDFTTPSYPASRQQPSIGLCPTSQAAGSSSNFSCADAFKTLSRHPAFDIASKDIGEWLPRLATMPSHDSNRPDYPRSAHHAAGAHALPHIVPQNGQTAGVPPRTAFDIEAASVMGVLKFFDRRFGRER